VTDPPRDPSPEAADDPASDPDGPEAGNDGMQEPDAGPPLDLVRRRRIRRIAGGGIVLGVLLSLGVGAAGGTGRAGAAILLLLSAAGCAVAATYGVLTAVLDDLRGRGVSRRRVVWIVAMFAAAAGRMAMTAGIGG